MKRGKKRDEATLMVINLLHVKVAYPLFFSHNGFIEVNNELLKIQEIN